MTDPIKKTKVGDRWTFKVDVRRNRTAAATSAGTRSPASRRRVPNASDREAGRAAVTAAVNLTLIVITMGLKVAQQRGLVVHNVDTIVDRVESDSATGAAGGDWQASDTKKFLRSVSEHRMRAAFVLSLLGLRRGEVTGLRWSDVDLTGDLAGERKLPKGTPSIAIVNNHVAVDGEIYEGSPKGKGRRRVPYLPIPLCSSTGSVRRGRSSERSGSRPTSRTGRVRSAAVLMPSRTRSVCRTGPSGTRTSS